MTNFPEYMPQVEKLIVNRLISAVLKAGWTISVFDGEEWALKTSTNRAAIQAETAATDETTYRIRSASGEALGQIWLVHGNGTDVISDYTDNGDMDLLIDPVMEYAGTQEGKVFGRFEHSEIEAR